MMTRNLMTFAALAAASAAVAAEGNMYGNQSQNEGMDVVPLKGAVTASTNLVNDQPGEAKINPQGFCEVQFK